MARILVVDDSLFARMKICSLLEGAGHETIEAANGREGLEAALREKPDCIFSDMLMPELDGIGFITALKEQEVRLPVVVLTADIQASKRRQCLELGVAGFLNKPPHQEELVNLLHRILPAGGEE